MIVNNYSTFREVFATSSSFDVAGYRVWPSNKVGLAGFAHDMTFQKPIPSFPVNTSANFDADAVPGVDEYDWYLSQRTDDTAKQYLAITQFDDGSANTYSGSVTISLTPFAVSTLGLADATSAVSIDNLIFLLKHVDLYARRRSDDAIQHVKILEYTLANL